MKCSSILGKQLLRYKYEDRYGIYPHLNVNVKSSPLALVGKRDVEDSLKNTRMKSVLKTFADLDIGKIFNISLPDYLKLPVHYTKSMAEIASDINKKTNRALSDINNQLNNSKKEN